MSCRHRRGALRRRAPASRHRQRGVAFYLFILAAAGALAVLGYGARSLLDGHASRLQSHDRVLDEARRLVLAMLLSVDGDAAPRRLGEPRGFPDLPIAAGGGADAVEPSYDGLAETVGCAYRGWAPGMPLVPVATSGAAARCIGRLPWRDLGFVPPDGDHADAQGAIPWLIVSPNLAVAAGCLPDFTPIGLAQIAPGAGCDGRPPYPWIRVVDERGNLLSDRVAVALLVPGPPVAGQARSAAAGPAAWLDRLTILPGCAAPCQPGTYDNANYNHADGQPTVLIAGPRGPVRGAAALYQEPVEFNDRLVWITVDDLAAAMESRARRALVARLQAFRTLNGHYPYVAATGSTTGDCIPGLRFGQIAVQAGACGAGSTLALPTWFTAGGWHRYFFLAVSLRCVAVLPACNAPGLLVGTDNDVDALVLSPGAPITTAPYALARLGPQAPLVGFTRSVLPADYLDSIANAAGLPDVFELLPTLGAPVNDIVEIVR
ncbi:MAG: hypothetical protein AB7G13_29360 [Lautropia sp.]